MFLQMPPKAGTNPSYTTPLQGVYLTVIVPHMYLCTCMGHLDRLSLGCYFQILQLSHYLP